MSSNNSSDNESQHDDYDILSENKDNEEILSHDDE